MAKRYEKVRTIGKGGFSTVYLVRDTQRSPAEKCVLKEMDVVQMSAVILPPTALSMAFCPPLRGHGTRQISSRDPLWFRRSRRWPSKRSRCYGHSTTQTSSSTVTTSSTKALPTQLIYVSSGVCYQSFARCPTTRRGVPTPRTGE